MKVALQARIVMAFPPSDKLCHADGLDSEENMCRTRSCGREEWETPFGGGEGEYWKTDGAAAVSVSQS